MTAAEAKTYRDKLLANQKGELSPYKAVHAALRELTGKDAEPTAAAWRKVLGL